MCCLLLAPPKIVERLKGLRKYHLTLPERKAVANQPIDAIAEILPSEEADLVYCT